MDIRKHGDIERLLTLREVCEITGKGRSTIYAGMAAKPPVFPRPIKDGASSRWLKSEISTWIEDRIAARDGKAVA